MGRISKEQSKFAGDVVLNIVSSAIPQLLLQLIVLPFLANKIGDEEYGFVVSIVSLLSLVSIVLGNVLNNVRLLYNSEYEERKLVGDFNLLLLLSLFLNTLIIVIVVSLLYTKSVITIILIVITSYVILGHNYLSVWFRIILDYKKITIDSCFLGIGFLIGLRIWMITGLWQLIYICGYGASCLFILFNKNLLKEPYRKTSLFRKTRNASAILSVSCFLENTLNYIDKIVLFPLLGGSLVSVYYSASVVGKITSMVFSPVSSVVLSHISKKKELSSKTFSIILLFLLCIAGVSYFVTYFIGKFLLFFLYPGWANESLIILPFTVAVAVVVIIDSMINPFVMKFCKLINQIIINLICVCVYFISCFMLYKKYELIGFVLGVLITRFIRLLLLITVFYKENRKSMLYKATR